MQITVDPFFFTSIRALFPVESIVAIFSFFLFLSFFLSSEKYRSKIIAKIHMIIPSIVSIGLFFALFSFYSSTRIIKYLFCSICRHYVTLNRCGSITSLFFFCSSFSVFPFLLCNLSLRPIGQRNDETTFEKSSCGFFLFLGHWM